MCSKQWVALRKRYSKAIKAYKNIRSGEDYPADLDWLVVTEMQFLENHIQNRPTLSTLDSQRLSSFSADWQIPSTSSFNSTEQETYNPSSFTPLHDYTEKLQDEKERFSQPLLPRKTNIWSSPWNDKEKLRPFQALLSEKVPEFDDFAKAKFAKRRGIISNVEDFGRALDKFSANIIDKNNEKNSYYEILGGLMRQMTPEAKKKFMMMLNLIYMD